MVGGKEVMSPSVMISPPHIDVDLYKSFDELHQRTVDKILSDEASFETSFDDYSGSDGINADDDQKQCGEDQVSNLATVKDSGYADSPYFSTKKRSRTQRTAQRHISRNDSNDDEGYDDRDSLADVDLGGHNAHQTVDNGEHLDDASEEDIIFASVDLDRRMELLTFITSHSFMEKGEYPVLRSARRRFVRDLRRQSLSVGMKEADLGPLMAYVKRTYLELFGNGPGSWDGSQFGDEIQDESSSQESRSKSSKKEKKRKRNTDEDQGTASKENVKATSKKRMSHGLVANGDGMEHDAAVPNPTGSISKPLADRPQVTENEATAVAEEAPKITIDLCKSDGEGADTPTESHNLLQPLIEHIEAAEKKHSLPSCSESKAKSCSPKQKKNAELRSSQQSPNKRPTNARPSSKSPPKHDEKEKDTEMNASQVCSPKDEDRSIAKSRQPGPSMDDKAKEQDPALSKKERNKRKRNNRKLRKKKYNIFRASLSEPEEFKPSTGESDLSKNGMPKTASQNVVTLEDLAILDEEFWDLEDF
ncbi:uncharacterized protein BO80DRAFT_358538 [Aspergillus ibericus CBS 121593]|uniref:Uncharacterized protein n=1 Tax=Aspergillus ibericus CBS 121593 TaxID=1448316 RepID=A0A395GX85_9EURO|nr:hypothetical protein BO80DRAFT_358538 [Aspergillus ibericus CBS 121593]RAK99648.1 hypothetical protein BO80DRAFT_358538 [Aspergillus ibericus CBS 121593]